ncbi:MAG: futalosine hydrolase [Candidatus Cohnella colombiensis]|uniref:Futalosine hydrolase n=1 Tax=Candidatus Cohnella colombiensis TaxID=3121368 RepID=A0AA95J9P3_9BACL|nr:MAG: futalosine hydrolase [Cohnella sp.]
MNKKVLIMVAVEAEQTAVLRGLRGNNSFEVKLAGVGPVAATINTAKALIGNEYSYIISAGIAGGFEDRAEIGSIVVASEMIAGDLGAETPEGFSSLNELGFGSTIIKADTSLSNRYMETLSASAIVPVHLGPIITMSTVTGTAATASRLASRIPGVIAEGMEGFGVASAAQAYGLSALEIRTISNCVGPRDKSAWRIGDALLSLEQAFTIIPEVLL